MPNEESNIQFKFSHSFYYFSLFICNKNKIEERKCHFTSLSYISFKRRNNCLGKGICVRYHFFSKFLIRRTLFIKDTINLFSLHFKPENKHQKWRWKWCILITLGKREGPSKWVLIYLIRSRLSPLTSLLCSRDGT